MTHSNGPLFEHASQRANLDRVYSTLAPTILAFVSERTMFHMAELTEFVRETHPQTAPDSAGRILRQLRLAHQVDYRVENRRASLYRIVRVPEQCGGVNGKAE